MSSSAAMAATVSPSGSALPWLLVIDLQRVFGERGSPWFTPGFDDALAGTSRLRAAFGPRVILTRFVPPAEVHGAWSDYYRRWAFALDPAHAALFDLVPGCPVDGARVVDRPTFGKWDAALLRGLEGATVVLAGVSTDCCVLSTALAAVDAGVRVRVAADACGGTTTASHQRALDVMALYAPNIEITTVAAVLAEQQDPCANRPARMSCARE